MKETEEMPVDGQIEFVTFREVVEQITGAKFDDIYKDYIAQGDINESELA